MPDDRSITLYKNDREMKVTPAWYKANSKDAKMLNGWSTKKGNPPSSDAPGPASLGSARGGFSGQMPPATNQPGAASRALSGFGQGINPLNSPPAGTPSTGSKARDVGEDMLNLRDIGEKGKSGDIAGGVGEMAGTIAGLAGPELLKGGAMAFRGSASVASVARAGERAADLAKAMGRPIETATRAAELTQPILDSVSKQYNRLHALLDKEVLAHDPKILQQGKQMEAAAEPYIRKLGKDILQKTRSIGGSQVLMEYGDAHGLHNQIQRALSKLDAYKIGQWEPTLKELDGLIEAGKAKVAQAKGLGTEWEKLGTLYRQTNELAQAIVTRMSGPSGVIGKTLEKAGIREALPKGTMKQAGDLAKKAGVSARSLPRQGGVGRLAGTGAQVAGPSGRGIMSLLGGDSGGTPAPFAP
jgi:hypothetical protein